MKLISNNIIDIYLIPFDFERSVYKRIGIPFLGKYIPTGGSKFSIADPVIDKRLSKEERIISFYNTTVKAEIIHLISAIVIIWLLYSYCNDGAEIFILLIGMVINLIFNIYPIFLQRYNRARLLNRVRIICDLQKSEA